MSKTRSIRIQSNLLQQNCFVRDVVGAVDLRSSEQPASYISLDEKICDDGTKVEYNSYPYPITPESVNSYVDSVDYHKDPSGAIANGVKRVNLGDVSQIQSLQSLDSSSQRALYEQLKAKFAVSELPKTQSGTELPKTQSGTELPNTQSQTKGGN